MKTAFLSEFITSKNVLMQSVVIYVVVSLVIGVSMQSPIAMVACIGAMTPFLMVFTFCALDGLNGWERFRATLPVSRAAIVASRYANVLVASVFVLFLGWAVALALSAAVSVLPFDADTVEAFASEASDPTMLLCAGVLGMGVTLFAASFILPFAMRYGMTKAVRIVPVVLIMLLPASAPSARYGAVALRYLDVARPECRFGFGHLHCGGAGGVCGELRRRRCDVSLQGAVTYGPYGCRIRTAAWRCFSRIRLRCLFLAEAQPAYNRGGIRERSPK